MTSKRDLEADLRRQLGRDARICVGAVRRGQGTHDSVIDYLVDRSFGSPDRLRDAAELLDEDEDQAARALLNRAVRRAADPPPPAPPKPFSPPDAPR
jgi:hypothetical protein